MEHEPTTAPSEARKPAAAGALSTLIESLGRGEPERVFLDGSRYWTARLASVRIGLGHFRPGWVWSRHAGAQTGRPSQAHIGIINSGAMVVRDADGTKHRLRAGDVFEVGPGHDAWVEGEEPCIALDVTILEDSGG